MGTVEKIHKWANDFFKPEKFNIELSKNDLYKDFKKHYPEVTVKNKMFRQFLYLWAVGNGYKSLIDCRRRYILLVT
jgi:hypothetical protein